VGAHRGLGAAFTLELGQDPVGIDLVEEPALECRPSGLGSFLRVFP